MISGRVTTVVADRKLRQVTPAIVDSIRTDFVSFLIEMQSHIKENKLSGQRLNRRTGTLSRSVHVQPLEEDSTGITGQVTAGKDAKYGQIHEDAMAEHTFMAPALADKTEAFYRMVRGAVAKVAI